METISTKDYRKRTYNFVFGAADISQTADIDPDLGVKGEVVKLVATVPNWTNAVTSTIRMNNADSMEIFAADPLARNDDYDITLIADECIIMGDSGEEWEVLLSGVPGNIGTVILTAYVKR